MAGRPRSSRVDDALQAAALSLFVERGLAGFTLDEVARRASVSRTALYRRWSNREDLLGDALRGWRDAYNDRSSSQAATLSEAIEDLTRKASDALADPFVRALLRRVLTIGPEGRAVLEPYWTQAVAAQRADLTRLIVAAQEAGQVDAAIDPAIAQDAVAGALTVKLLSGEADQTGFDTRRYIGDLWRAVGLRLTLPIAD